MGQIASLQFFATGDENCDEEGEKSMGGGHMLSSFFSN